MCDVEEVPEIGAGEPLEIRDRCILHPWSLHGNIYCSVRMDTQSVGA